MNIVLYDKQEDTIELLKEHLSKYEKNIHVAAESTVITELAQGKQVVFITALENISEGIKETLTLHNIYLIAYTSDTSPKAFKKALECNAKEFLILPLVKEELLTALQKAESYVKTVHVVNQSTVKLGKVITLLSTKGGVGKSLLAVNLAQHLIKHLKYKVLLIDTVMRFGSLDILIDTIDNKSLSAIPVSSEQPEAYLQDIKDNTIHHSSGLDLLSYGNKNDDQYMVEKVKNIIAVIKSQYDYIIIDTKSGVGEKNMTLMELADQLVLVSALDLAALKNLKLGIDSIKTFYYSTDKLKIVLNRYDATCELTLDELEKFLKSKVTGMIPEQRDLVIRSINKGIPLVMEQEKSEISQAILKLAYCLAGKECKLTDKVLAESGTGGLLSTFKNLFKDK